MNRTATVLQSVLDSAGPQAARIEWLFWVMFWVTAVVYVAVMIWIVMAAVRGFRQHAAEPGTARRRSSVEASSDRSMYRAVAAAVGATVLILLGLLVASVATNRAVASLGADSAVTIKVTGHQWWWEAEYESGTPSEQFKTANELHIPDGRPGVDFLMICTVIRANYVCGRKIQEGA